MFIPDWLQCLALEWVREGEDAFEWHKMEIQFWEGNLRIYKDSIWLELWEPALLPLQGHWGPVCLPASLSGFGRTAVRGEAPTHLPNTEGQRERHSVLMKHVTCLQSPCRLKLTTPIITSSARSRIGVFFTPSLEMFIQSLPIFIQFSIFIHSSSLHPAYQNHTFFYLQN